MQSTQAPVFIDALHYLRKLKLCYLKIERSVTLS